MIKPYFENENGRLLHGNCLEIMAAGLPDGCVDMILCDLPYGTTACKWDTVIPFEPLWKQYKRLIKKNGAIVLTASQPFTSALVMSNAEWFRYSLVWDKVMPVGHLNAQKMPLRQHEDVLVFGGNQYHPQMSLREKTRTDNRTGKEYKNIGNQAYGTYKATNGVYTHFYPRSILKFSNADQRKDHPTQKPVSLFQYLILTYTNPWDTVMDNCSGSSTTAIACERTGRKWICIEQEETFCELSAKRIQHETQQLKLFT